MRIAWIYPILYYLRNDKYYDTSDWSKLFPESPKKEKTEEERRVYENTKAVFIMMIFIALVLIAIFGE